MADEFETEEIEISEDDILYYLVDEDGNEIGVVIEEDGQEVECYYEGIDGSEFEVIGELDEETGEIELDSLAELDGEVVEMEISEDDIDHYIVDEQGNEIGFVIIEDGHEVECLYADDEEEEDEDADADEAPEEPYVPQSAEDHGYLYKMASIAGFTGNKARKKAGAELDKVRGKAEAGMTTVRAKAEQGVDKATEAVEAGGKKLQEKKDEYDLGITREGVAEATADLNAIAKEGAETAKELKEAYDDIMDSFGFLMPKKLRKFR